MKKGLTLVTNENFKVKETERGFSIAEFIDRYDKKCSIQDSSLATEACVWLGIHDPDPQIMARDAKEMGLVDLLPPLGDPERLNGWVPFPLPESVQITTRMHLTVDMAKELRTLLNRFIETGSIKPADSNSLSMAGTATGRMSCSEPNPSNLPRVDDRQETVTLPSAAFFELIEAAEEAATFVESLPSYRPGRPSLLKKLKQAIEDANDTSTTDLKQEKT